MKLKAFAEMHFDYRLKTGILVNPETLSPCPHPDIPEEKPNSTSYHDKKSGLRDNIHATNHISFLTSELSKSTRRPEVGHRRESIHFAMPISGMKHLRRATVYAHHHCTKLMRIIGDNNRGSPKQKCDIDITR